MIRLLIFIAAIYFASRYIKSIFKTIAPEKPAVKDTPIAKIDDVMVKDPVCNVYFPQKNGVHVKIQGRHLYFCSPECRDKYVASAGKSAKT